MTDKKTGLFLIQLYCQYLCQTMQGQKEPIINQKEIPYEIKGSKSK